MGEEFTCMKRNALNYSLASNELTFCLAVEDECCRLDGHGTTIASKTAMTPHKQLDKSCINQSVYLALCMATNRCVAGLVFFVSLFHVDEEDGGINLVMLSRFCFWANSDLLQVMLLYQR